MNLFGYSDQAAGLLELGNPNTIEENYDYIGEHGLEALNVQELIRMAGDIGLHQTLANVLDEAEVNDEKDDDEYFRWAHIHALRALAQLEATEAIVALMSLVTSRAVTPLENDLMEFYLSFEPKDVLPVFEAYMSPGHLVQSAGFNFITLTAAFFAQRGSDEREAARAFFRKRLETYDENADVRVNAFMCSGLCLISDTENLQLILEVLQADEIDSRVFSVYEFARYIDRLLRDPQLENYDRDVLLGLRERVRELIAERGFLRDESNPHEKINPLFFEAYFFYPDNPLQLALLETLADKETPEELAATMERLKNIGENQSLLYWASYLPGWAQPAEEGEGAGIWLDINRRALTLIPGDGNDAEPDGQRQIEMQAFAPLMWSELLAGGRENEIEVLFLCNLAFLSLARRYENAAAIRLDDVHTSEVEDYLRRLLDAGTIKDQALLDEMFGYEPRSLDPVFPKFLLAVTIEIFALLGAGNELIGEFLTEDEFDDENDF